MTEQGNEDETVSDGAEFGTPEYLASFADRVRTPLLPDDALICGLEDSAWNDDGGLTRPLTARETTDIKAGAAL